MSTNKFDVIVVGGGPAGSAAARTLSTAGIKVCLLDKENFPREKLCGGLLTMRSKKIYDQVFQTSWDPVIEKVSRGVSFFSKDSMLRSLRDYKDLFSIQRRNFDHFLLRLAADAGTELRLGLAVKNVDCSSNILQLSDGTELSAKHIIGADGVNSRVARSLYGQPFNNKWIGFGLEMEVPLKDGFENIPDPEIYFGVVKYGYGWVFPKKDTMTAGIGGLLSKNPDMRQEFETFLKARFGRVPNAGIKGCFIPTGDYRMPPGRKNILLCGDAANLAEPITGEGISFAMQSGHYAALSVIESNRTGKSVMELYLKRYREITNAFDYSRKLRYLVFPGPCERALTRSLSKTESLAKKHMDLMAGDLEYPEYFRHIIWRTCKKILKKIIGE